MRLLQSVKQHLNTKKAVAAFGLIAGAVTTPILESGVERAMEVIWPTEDSWNEVKQEIEKTRNEVSAGLQKLAEINRKNQLDSKYSSQVVADLSRSISRLTQFNDELVARLENARDELKSLGCAQGNQILVRQGQGGSIAGHSVGIGEVASLRTGRALVTIDGDTKYRYPGEGVKFGRCRIIYTGVQTGKDKDPLFGFKKACPIDEKS